MPDGTLYHQRGGVVGFIVRGNVHYMAAFRQWRGSWELKTLHERPADIMKKLKGKLKRVE